MGEGGTKAPLTLFLYIGTNWYEEKGNLDERKKSLKEKVDNRRIVPKRSEESVWCLGTGA